MQMIDAPAGPNIDVMQVGHAVSREFLLRKPHGEGIESQIARRARRSRFATQR